MVLRLLPRTPPGPDPLEPQCSRFGDWREPFAFASEVDVDSFVAAAGGLRVDVHIAATVAIEAQLLAETVATAGIDAAGALTTLDAAASAAGSVAALEGTRYRQALHGLARFAAAGSLTDGSIALPTRLHRRAAAADLARALTEQRLQQGVRWELAALGEGRFIEDWGLAVLARVAR